MRETDRKINALTGGSRESSNNVRKTLKKQNSDSNERSNNGRKTAAVSENRATT
jgi:hypothetical protein